MEAELVSRDMGYSEASLMRFWKGKALRRQGGVCLYCTLEMTPKQATADHRVPRLLGRGPGRTTPQNIDALCRECNAGKGSRLAEEFLCAIHEPDLERDGPRLYAAAMGVRIRRASAEACRRLWALVGLP